MPNVDYGQVRQERVWVTRELVFNTQALAQSRDAVVLRGRGTLPSVLTERVPSEEVRPQAPDTDFLIARKKPPGEFELPCYAKAPSVKGRLPQWASLLLDVMGVEQIVLEVLIFGNLVGDTVTVTINGTPNVLTEGAQFTAAGSNAATATSLAAAIHALAGVSATAVGAEVLVTRDAGTGEVTITTSAADADLNREEIRYKLATDILEKSLTISHLADNVLHVYRGCKVSAAAFEVSGSDEGTIRFSGFLGNEVLCAYHTLDGTIDNVVTTITVEEVPRILVGPNPDDVVFILIDSEQMKVTAVNYSTKQLTVVRGQNGTTPAGHTDGAEIAPVFPATDPEPADTILPMTLGSFQVDGVTYRVAEATTTDDERLNPRMDEWGESALTGYRRPLEGRAVSCNFTAYQRKSVLDLLTLAERGVTVPLVMTIGKASALSPLIILSMPKYQFERPEKEERAGEYARAFTGMGLASTDPGNDGLNIIVRAP